MSDFWSFTSSKKGIEFSKKVDPIMYSDENPEVVILFTDKQYTGMKKAIFKKLLKLSWGRPVNIRMVYVFNRETNEKEYKNKGIENFFVENTIDLAEHIPEGVPVITTGRAVYAITKDSRMTPHTFHDAIWNKTYFYYPYSGSWVFPVSWFSDWYDISSNRPKDTFYYQMVKHQLRLANKVEEPSVRIPKRKHHLLKDPNEFLREYKDHKVPTSWDIETSTLVYYEENEAPISCVTISFGGLEGWYLPWEKIDLNLLNEFFQDRYQIGANLSFDLAFLWDHGVTNAKVDFDIVHAGHTLNEIRSNSQKVLAWIYTYFGDYEVGLEQYKRNNPRIRSYSDIPTSVRAPYAIDDAIICHEIYEAQLEHLNEDPELKEYFFTYRMPLVQIFAETRQKGVYVNWNKVQHVGEELVKERSKIIQQLNEHFGTSKVDWSSSTQLSEFLIDKARWPVILTGKSGVALTNETCLQAWSKQGYKGADLLLKFREVRSLIDTFVGSEKDNNAYWKLRDSDGLLHPEALVMMAKSHRFRYKNPNLQQVPHHGEKAELIRSFFDVPDDYWWILSRDYSGLQLRIAAMLSEDDALKQAFIDGKDLHSVTCQLIFETDKTVDEVKKLSKTDIQVEMNRFLSKRSNFLFLFRGSAWSFCEDTIRPNWNRKQCLEYIDNRGIPIKKVQDREDPHLTVATDIRNRFFEAYPGLEPWHGECVRFAEENGYIRYEHGGRRLLPELTYQGKEDDPKLLSNLKNISVNSRVQNFETVIMGRAIINFEKYRKENNYRSWLFTMIHDDLGWYIHKEESDLIQKTERIMTTDYPEYKGVPLEVDGDLADPRSENPTYWGYGEEV